MLTPEQIQAIRTKAGVSPTPQMGASNISLVEKLGGTKVPVTQPSAYETKVVEPLGRFSEGFVKELGSTAKNTLGLLQAGGQKVIAAIDPTKTYEQIRKETGFETLKPETEAGQKATELLTPKGTAEEVGAGVATLAEFLVPATKAAKAEQAISLLSKGIVSPLAAATTRIVGKGAVQGLAAGGVELARTGDIKKAGETALTAGLVRGAFATIGEGARALRLPERMYSTIFKNTKQDMFSELKENGLKALQQNNPQLYEEWVKKGLIKVGKDGNPLLNETLAEQALDKGLRGSIKTMANNVVENTIRSEDEVRTVLQNYKGTVSLAEPQFVRVLKSIAQEYEDVGFGEIATEANRLVNALKNGKGQVSGIDALDIRRLLDKARIARSFDVPATKLSLSQANLKQLADSVRGRVNSIENVGSLMKDYSFYIDALESLASEAKRRGNNQVLGLIDTIFLGSGMAGGVTPQGAIMALVSKYLRSGHGSTALGTLLNKSVASPATIGVTGAVSSKIQSAADLQ